MDRRRAPIGRGDQQERGARATAGEPRTDPGLTGFTGDERTLVAMLGGLAALASAITRGKRERQDRAVGDCSQEAEYRGDGRVSDIISVRKSRGYYTVEGILDRGAGSESFLCTVRNGRIYSFRSGPAEI